MLTIDVVGTPAPQGSKRAFYNPKAGRAVVVDDNKPQLRNWRQDVKAAALNAIAAQGVARAEEPVRVEVVFYLPRPGYHYRTGKHAGELKPSAPDYVDKKPDLDKLLRSTLDGLKEAGVYRDDAQVAVVAGTKRYANTTTGARIAIAPVEEPVEPTVPAAAVTSIPQETPEAAAAAPTGDEGALF